MDHTTNEPHLDLLRYCGAQIFAEIATKEKGKMVKESQHGINWKMLMSLRIGQTKTNQGKDSD